MGRKSVKENKNVYQLSREAAGMTREEASEAMYISADRIEKLESEKLSAHPEDILAMSECYKDATLCNYYCSHECPIGQKYVPSLEVKDIAQITLELLNSLNTLDKLKNRMIEITVDGKIEEDEKKDFNVIYDELNEVMKTVQTLRMWIEHVNMNA